MASKLVPLPEAITPKRAGVVRAEVAWLRGIRGGETKLGVVSAARDTSITIRQYQRSTTGNLMLSLARSTPREDGQRDADAPDLRLDLDCPLAQFLGKESQDGFPGLGGYLRTIVRPLIAAKAMSGPSEPKDPMVYLMGLEGSGDRVYLCGWN